MKTMWKFLNLDGKTIVSNHGSQKWKIGEWVHVDGDYKLVRVSKVEEIIKELREE